MEALPEVYQPAPQPTAIRGGDGTDIMAKQKFQNISDAIRNARDVIRDPELLEEKDPDPYGFAQQLENEFGIDLLTAGWKSHPGDQLWEKRIKARARKATVARLYLQGVPVSDIAMKVRVSDVTVYKDIASISTEWRRSYMNDIEALASRDLARLDEMFSALFDDIEKGDTRAIAAGIEIIKERGNILGYRQGVQVDIEQHIREIASAQGYDPDKAVSLAQRISVKYH
jgi:hypothetical protein